MRYINFHNPFIVRITRPEQRIVAVGTTAQPCLHGCIRGNKSRFAAHFNRHVAEREAFTHRHLLNQRSGVLDSAIVSPNNDIARDYVTAFWHHLVADAFLQNADILLMSKSPDIALQCCCCNSRRRHDMIEDNMRPVWIENAPTTLMGQLAKCLNCQWGRGIMTHHTINIHHDRLSLLYSSTQLVTKDFLG